MTSDTKERILDAAERLFADHGFPATSMRDITQEAGVNLAAVNYHFGSKEALMIAVLERSIAPVNRARLEQLDALEAAAGDAPVETEQIVRAFLTPLFEKWCEWGHGDPKFLKLVGRIHAESTRSCVPSSSSSSTPSAGDSRRRSSAACLSSSRTRCTGACCFSSGRWPTR